MKRILLAFVAGLLACGAAVAQRLPGGANPEHYALTVNMNFSNNSYDGDERIDLTLAQPTNAITLNAVEIDFREVAVSAGGLTQTAKVSTDEKNEMATFTVDKQLAAGAATVHIKFTGHLNEKLRGFYLSTYKGKKYEVSQMESTDARVAFPCFDEPAYKATFEITAIVDKGDTAISNNQIASDTPGPGDKHTIKFAASPKMSSYLVALTVGDWKCASDSVDGIKISVCTVPGKENMTRFPLDATKAILHYYNNYYAIKYPLPKLDEIAVPDFQAGAMENWGAIIYRESALLVDDKMSSEGYKQGVADTIAHEVAHQWFGDLVTMKWWDDVWLNEGFATWMAPHPVAQWKPDWMEGQDVVDNTVRSLATDSKENTRPIHQDAETRGEIDSLFDGIAYGKTAAVLHMLESYLGPEKFRAGVNLYLKEHAYSNATASDFWNAMARSTKQPVDQIMPTFVMQPGAPFVAVEAKCQDGNTTLNMSQKRFLNTPTAFNQPSDQVWQIPVCASGVNDSGAGKRECFLLKERQQQFTMKGCPKFVFPDAGALGYYRFDYDAAALRSLGNAVEHVLTPEERIVLLSNEWALMNVGRHNVGDYLALGDQLKNTPGADLIEGFGEHLAFINTRLVTDADRQDFQAWVRNTFSPMMHELGYASRPNDTPEVKQKRALVFRYLGNIGQDPEVLQKAQALVQDYMNDPASVDPTLAGAVVSVAAQHGDAELYQQYKAELQKVKSPQQYYRFLNGLGEFPEPALIQQTLQSTLTPEVRGQDLYMLVSMLSRPTSQGATWEFMRQNVDALMQKSGGGLGGVDFFLAGARSFCSEQKADELKQFFTQHPFPGTERNQKETLETISSCIQLGNQQRTKLAAFLKENRNGNATAAAGGGKSTTGSMR